MKFRYASQQEVEHVLAQAGRSVELHALSHLIHLTLAKGDAVKEFQEQHDACLADRNAVIALTQDLIAPFVKEETDGLPEGS